MSANPSRLNGILLGCATVVCGRLPRLAYPVATGPLRGARFVLGAFAGECQGISVYFNLAEPEQMRRMASLMKRGQTFFDIGANAGLYTVLGARLVGHEGCVVAFEPLPRNVAFLHRHVLLNRLAQVRIMPSACSDKLGVDLFSAGHNCAMGHLSNTSGPAAHMPVATVTIDQFVERTKLVPDVMKIDVEGAEWDVLRGAHRVLRDVKPTVFLSLHSAALKAACIGYVEELGYVCDRVRGGASELIVYHPDTHGQ